MKTEQEIIAKAYEDHFNTQVYKESNLHHTYGKVILNAMKLNYNQAIDDAIEVVRNYNWRDKLMADNITLNLQSLKK